MDAAIRIKTPDFRFNFKHLFALLLLAVSIYLSITFGVAWSNSNSTNKQYNYQDMSEIAEEIYNSGEITEALKNLPLDAAIIAKMSAEIEGILAKTTDYPNCELYYLTVRVSGYYPILGYGNQILGTVFLNVGEVWKVGQTGNGEEIRYSNSKYYVNKSLNFMLSDIELDYVIIAQNNYKYILILEKLLIYTYPFWSGHPELLKPPRCKIFR